MAANQQTNSLMNHPTRGKMQQSMGMQERESFAKSSKHSSQKPLQMSKMDSSVDNDLQKILDKDKNKNIRYEIKINQKLTMDFDQNDDIFQLTEKVGTKIRSNNCISCQKDVSSSKVQFCDFCGSRACKTCMHKQRRFYGNNGNLHPNLIIFDQSKGPTGLCCKICDRKFYMWSSFIEYREKTLKQDQLIIETNSDAQEKNL